MTANLDHVLLTRFNLPSKGHESLVRAQENWLKNRVMLFERYCLPSVLAQTCRSFSWIIYFDPESPVWLLDWVRSHEQWGYFNPYFREEVPGRIYSAISEPSWERSAVNSLRRTWITTMGSPSTSWPECRTRLVAAIEQPFISVTGSSAAAMHCCTGTSIRTTLSVPSASRGMRPSRAGQIGTTCCRPNASGGFAG